MSEDTAEVIHIKNAFGTVTDRRVIYFRSKGWLSSGSKEVIPLQRVTSVRLEISRHYLLGIPTLLIGLGLLAGHGVLPVTGGVAMLFAVLFALGFTQCCGERCRPGAEQREGLAVAAA